MPMKLPDAMTWPQNAKCAGSIISKPIRTIRLAPMKRKAISAIFVVERVAIFNMYPARICCATLQKRHGGKMLAGLITAFRSGARRNWPCAVDRPLILRDSINATSTRGDVAWSGNKWHWLRHFWELSPWSPSQDGYSTPVSWWRMGKDA
jgi:hypothetical protein